MRRFLVDQNKRSLKLIFDYFSCSVKKADILYILSHYMQQTRISQLLADHHPITAVSEGIGHSNIHVILDIYGRVISASDAEMMRAFDMKLE